MMDQVQIFHGELTPYLGRLYVKAARPSEGDWKLDGFVEGPIVEGGHVLPTRTALRDLGPGDTLLAGAAVTDPCGWFPARPARYRVSITATDAANGEEAAGLFEFAFSSLGVRGQSLYWEGRRWVARGVTVDAAAAPAIDLTDPPAPVLLIDQPDDAFCQQASAAGVPLAVTLNADREPIDEELERLARHPAVRFAAVRGSHVALATLREAAPNLILAPWIDPAQNDTPPPEADIVVVEASDIDAFAALIKRLSCAVIAWRPTHEEDLIARRAACDTLQKDLAPHGDFAGYWV